MTEKEKEELDQLLEKIDEFLKLAKKGAPLVTIDTFPIRKRNVRTISLKSKKNNLSLTLIRG